VYEAPCYWKDGIKIDLPDDTDLQPGSPRAAYALGIYTVGNEVYTVGRYNLYNGLQILKVQPCYWKNTTRFDITDYPDRFAELSCIFVSGGDVYIGGKYLVQGTSGPTTAYQACYWKNGVRTDLPAGMDSYVHGIFVENGKVYATGSWKNEIWPPFNSTNCYWADGQRVDLPADKSEDDYNSVNAIFVDKGTVYTAGCSSGDACYWKDGKQTILPALKRGAEALSIYVKDGIVFTCGLSTSKSGVCYEPYASGGIVPCYWVNTKCTELSVEVPNWCDTYRNNAVGIFVE
jgi:hypothetical protein